MNDQSNSSNNAGGAIPPAPRPQKSVVSTAVVTPPMPPSPMQAGSRRPLKLFNRYEGGEDIANLVPGERLNQGIVAPKTNGGFVERYPLSTYTVDGDSAFPGSNSISFAAMLCERAAGPDHGHLPNMCLQADVDAQLWSFMMELCDGMEQSQLHDATEYMSSYLPLWLDPMIGTRSKESIGLNTALLQVLTIFIYKARLLTEGFEAEAVDNLVAGLVDEHCTQPITAASPVECRNLDGLHSVSQSHLMLLKGEVHDDYMPHYAARAVAEYAQVFGEWSTVLFYISKAISEVIWSSGCEVFKTTAPSEAQLKSVLGMVA